MSPLVAWIAALTVATSSASPPPGEHPNPGAPVDSKTVAVTLDLGPPLVRRMGLRITVRRAGDDPVAHRPVEVHELPRPATSDDPPTVAALELSAGEYILEAEAPGYLPSTRALTVDPATPPGQLAWQLIPDSGHRTVRFPVTAGASVPPTVTLTARHLAGEQEPVACTARRVPCEIRLRRGEWEVEARAPGFLPLRRVFTVGDPEEQEVALSLSPGLIDHALPPGPAEPAAPGPTEPPPTTGWTSEKKLLTGFALTGVPFIAAGLAMTVSGHLRFAQYAGSSECDTYGKTCADRIIPTIHVGGAGTGLLGAGVGLAVGGIAPARYSTTGWGATVAVGGVLTVAGGAWLIGNSVLLNRTLKTGPLDEIDGRNDRRMISAAMLGAGLGLLTSSVTAGVLIGLRGAAISSIARRGRVPRIDPYGGPFGAGVTLSGRF